MNKQDRFYLVNQSEMPLVSFDDMSMDARVKADNLIYLVRSTNTQINVLNSQFINYNDMEEFMDDLAFLYW